MRSPVISALVTALLVAVVGLVAGCTGLDPFNPRATEAPAPVAAFVVSSLQLLTEPDEIVPGANVEVAAVFENRGDLPSVYDAELLVGRTRLPAIEVRVEPGETERVVIAFEAGDPGTYRLALGGQQLVVDVLGPAHIVAESMALSAYTVEAGEELLAQVNVHNSGGVAGSQTIELLVDGKVTGEQEATVEGGATIALYFPLEFRKPGTYNISAGDGRASLDVVDIARPSSGKLVLDRIGRGANRFRVENDRSDDAFVILASSREPNRPLLGMYVRAGQKHTARGIRDGNYIVYYTVGKRWNRYSGHFTEGALFVRHSNILDFSSPARSYTIWTLELLSSPRVGAPQSVLINASQFPNLAGAGAR